MILTPPPPAVMSPDGSPNVHDFFLLARTPHPLYPRPSGGPLDQSSNFFLISLLSTSRRTAQRDVIALGLKNKILSLLIMLPSLSSFCWPHHRPISPEARGWGQE